MIKYLLVTLVMVLFFSCSNELDVNAEFQDIPIVYAILDASDTAQYIRLERVFQTNEESAIDVAKEIDSLYYPDATVSLISNELVEPIYLERVDGALEGYPREAGVFATEPNYLYKVKSSALDLSSENVYTLQIKRNEEAPLLTATTTMMSEPNILVPSAFTTLHFSETRKFVIKRADDDNGAIMDVILDIYIREVDHNPNGDPPVTNVYSWNVVNGYEKREFNGDGETFYKFLEGELVEDDKITRTLLWIDVNIITGGTEIKDYIKLGKANTFSITSSENVPTYSNLSEGYGIFSSTYKFQLQGLGISNGTIDSLEEGRYTNKFNFNQ